VDALASARLLRAAGFPSLVVDTSPHPHPSAQKLAAEMGARYLPLPHVDAGTTKTYGRHLVVGSFQGRPHRPARVLWRHWPFCDAKRAH
jgi:hypothetical protein